MRRGVIRYCVYRIDSPNLIRVHFSPGDTFPIEQGASGRIFLAFSKPFPPEFSTIRKKLIASSSGELAPEVAGICAPVFDDRGDIVGALAVSGPKSRFKKAAMRRAEPELIKAAAEISRRLFGDTYGLYQDALALDGRETAAK